MRTTDKVPLFLLGSNNLQVGFEKDSKFVPMWPDFHNWLSGGSLLPINIQAYFFTNRVQEQKDQESLIYEQIQVEFLLEGAKYRIQILLKQIDRI